MAKSSGDLEPSTWNSSAHRRLPSPCPRGADGNLSPPNRPLNAASRRLQCHAVPAWERRRFFRLPAGSLPAPRPPDRKGVRAAATAPRAAVRTAGRTHLRRAALRRRLLPEPACPRLARPRLAPFPRLPFSTPRARRESLPPGPCLLRDGAQSKPLQLRSPAPGFPSCPCVSGYCSSKGSCALNDGSKWSVNWPLVLYVPRLPPVLHSNSDKNTLLAVTT